MRQFEDNTRRFTRRDTAVLLFIATVVLLFAAYFGWRNADDAARQHQAIYGSGSANHTSQVIEFASAGILFLGGTVLITKD